MVFLFNLFDKTSRRKVPACHLTDITRDAIFIEVDTSVQRLFDNFVTHVIAERQAEARFSARQKRGNPVRGRKLLAEIRQRIESSSKGPNRPVKPN